MFVIKYALNICPMNMSAQKKKIFLNSIPRRKIQKFKAIRPNPEKIGFMFLRTAQNASKNPTINPFRACSESNLRQPGSRPA